MFRLLVSLALLLPASFALLLALSRLPHHDPVPALTACAVPCWQGIQVNATPRAEALAVMNQINGFEPRFAPCYDTGQISCELYQWRVAGDDAAGSVIEIRQGALYMIIDKPAGLMLGEMLLALERLGIPLYEYDVHNAAGQLYMELTFSQANLNVEADLNCGGSYLTFMQTPIRFVAFNAPVEVTHAPVPFRGVRHTTYELCER